MTSAVSASRRAALLASTLVFAALAVLAGGQAAHADAPAPQKLRWAGVKPDGTLDPVWDTRPGRDNFRLLDDKLADIGKGASFRDNDTVYFNQPKDHSVTIQGTVRPQSALFLSGTRSTLTGSGTIAGNASIHLFLGSELVIENANSYTGDTWLREGTLLTLGNDAALGAGTLNILGGTLQPSGGVREVPNAIDVGLLPPEDPLEVTLAGDHQLRLTGPIRLTRGAELLLLRVTNSRKVTVEGNVSEVTPGSSVHKVGPGTLEVTGITSYTGSTWVQEGELRLDTAIIRGRVMISDFEWLSGPKLTGFGTIDGDLSAVEGLLDPGLDNDTAGTFVVGGDLRMFRSRYAVDLHGPGSNDSITVDGPVVTLDGDLGLRFHYNPQVGDTFTIIDHRGKGTTTGPFGERWAEGAQIVVRGPTGLFVTMTITYRGGDGNDVVLTALSREQLGAGPPPTGDPVAA